MTDDPNNQQRARILITMNDETHDVDIRVEIDENGSQGSIHAAVIARIAARILYDSFCEVRKKPFDPSVN